MGEKIINTDFIIQIKGLSIGKHSYAFPIDGAFFRGFNNSQILDAKLNAELVLEKGSGWMRLEASVIGSVVVECDRCLENLELPVDINAVLQIKFAKTDEDPQSDEFLVVDPTSGELDLSQFLYDYICINLPLQKVHKDGECNEKMIEKLHLLNSYDSDAPKVIDSPFGNLKQLIGAKKK